MSPAVVEVMATGLPLMATGADGDGSPLALLLAGPAGAVAVYWLLFRYYRNTDKSHSFETETRVESAPITGGDQKVDEVRGTRRSAINGNNVSSHRDRVRRLS